MHLTASQSGLRWLIGIIILSDMSVPSGGFRTGRLQTSGVVGTEYVTTNRLADLSQSPISDYDTMLEAINGDFGIRSELVEAAGKEPEYKGSETLVVPLYIPEGAVPINLARIARSGNPEPVVELLDMKVSPSSDSVLIRRMGPVSPGRRPYRRPVFRPPQRTRPSRLPAIRRSDLVDLRPVKPPAPPLELSLVAGFGQRLSQPKAASPVTEDHVISTSSHELPHGSDQGDDTDNTKRAKKNELSKNSQFPEELHNNMTTEDKPSEVSLPSSSSATTNAITVTTARPTSTQKAIATSFPKPASISSTKFPKLARRRITSTTTPIAPLSSASVITTTESMTNQTPSSQAPSQTTSATASPTTKIKPNTTARTETLRKPPQISITREPPLLTEQTEESTKEEPVSLSANAGSDRRSVLFPRPVESILKIPKSEAVTSPSSVATTTAISTSTASPKPSTTAPINITTKASTANFTTTTVMSTTLPTSKTTTEATSSYNPASLRILPPWLSRSKSVTTSTIPPVNRPPENLSPFVRMRTMKRPLLSTNETSQLNATEKSETLKLTQKSITAAPRNLTGVTKLKTIVTRRPISSVRSPIKLLETSRVEDTTQTGTSTATTSAPLRNATASTKITTTRTTTTTKRPVTTSKTSTSVAPTTATTRAPTTLAAVASTRRPAFTNKWLSATSERPSIRTMPSVKDILRKSTNISEMKDSVASRANAEVLNPTPNRSYFTLRPVNTDETLKKTTTESSSVEESLIKDLVSKVEKEREEKLSNGSLSASNKEDEKIEALSKEPEKEAENKSIPFIPRKFLQRPQLSQNASDPKLYRPLRRRRPYYSRTTPRQPTTQTNLFKEPLETVLSRTTAEDGTTMTVAMKSSTKSLLATTMPTPAMPTDKSPEQIVIESLTEIMKEATNNNKSKDKVSSIASNLEALNKQLAEQGIHIIHAEVDGVKIKLDNRTITRPLLQPLPTTFRPLNFFKTIAASTTEHPPTTLISPSEDDESAVLLDTEKAEEELVDKQVYTSVQSSFSFHTAKPTDVEEETDSNNEVQSTTVDSSITTTKAPEIWKSGNVKDVLRPTVSPSLLSSVRYADQDTVMENKTVLDSHPDMPNVDRPWLPVQTSSPLGNREKEGAQDSIPSVAIFASSTVPASVTTRTRSTTVPITTHRPSLHLFSSSPSVYPQEAPKLPSSVDDDTKDENTEFSAPGSSQISTDIHPTAHHRPPLHPPIEKEKSMESVSIANGPKPANFSEVAITKRPSEKPVTPTTSRVTTRRPIIEVISITKELQDSAAGIPGPVAASEDNEHEDFTESTSSSTTVYIVGVIGIIPAAGLAAFLARKFLRKTQKALPESEERAEGFTPVTHHSRKPSQSNTLDVETSSVEAKNPKLSPWEFPRSKLRLVSVLGEGNFGVVWKAEARDLCACEGTAVGSTVLVAVKCVKEGAGSKERQDLLKELAIMQHIGQHPNIVTLLGCCTQQDPHHVIMEYVMFGKLLTFLRDHRTRQNYYNFSSDTDALTSKDLTRFACQIATGCDFLQTRGIIHRDLASRNILVDHNKVCKIADFGLARNVKDLGSDIYEQKSRGALPIRWMAPESLYMNIFTHKSDVWSLGILYWEIVTLGSTPYPGMTAREVMRRVREGYRLDRPEHCHPKLYHIVTKCWHQDLNKRPSFLELRLELSQLLEHGQMGYIDLENFPEATYFSMHENNEEKL